MTLTPTQQLALAAMADGKHRTRHEIRRDANLTALNGATLRALHDQGLIDLHDEQEPTTYTITGSGKAAMEAR
jgi:predicted transcriptional regulator